MYNTKFIMFDGREVYPGYLNLEERQALQKRFRNEREYMKCGCRPSANLWYRISEDFRIYPEHKSYLHDPFCSRYKKEDGTNQRQTAYIISDDGDVTVYTSFDPLDFSLAMTEIREQNNDVPEDNENMEEIVVEKDDEEGPVKEAKKMDPKLTLENLIRAINVDSFTEKVVNNKRIESREKFSTFVYYRMKKVRMARTQKFIGDMSLEKDGCRFIYTPFSGIETKEVNGSKKCYILTRGVDGKIYKNFIYPDTMNAVLKEYSKNYGIEPNENTMIAGFQYLKRTKSGVQYKVLGRVKLFQTSDIGLYCRSVIEVDTFNRLDKITLQCKGIKYWIPPEDAGVGAIIELEGNDKKILLLFKGNRDEHVSFDKTMYVPLVVDKNSVITEDELRALLTQ